MKRIILVCTGNTCRSPMAEVLLRDALIQQEIGLETIEVSSAGIFAADGERAMPQAIEVMKERHLDLEYHRSRRLTLKMIEEADLILTMTVSHKQSVLMMDAAASDRVYTLAEYTARANDSSLSEVPDPYGQSTDSYRKTAEMMEKRLLILAEKLKIEMEGVKTMKIAIGSDHGGFALKQKVYQSLLDEGWEITDFGTDSEESCDYPIFARKVAEAVTSGEFDKGILLCGTGIGISIAANKVPGIRCALVSDCYSARVARQHNDSNILAMGGRVLGVAVALDIVHTWLDAGFEGGRHQRRVDQINDLEKC